MVDSKTSNEHSSNRIAAIVTQVLGPALTIAVVASIAFFLIDISCSGPLVGRCKWIFALFCFAAVLISRISIQDGYQHAAIYGLFLAFATLLVSARFMQGNIVWLGLILAFVWWCAGRLTWDCTFIDATRDATGQGMIDLAIDRATRHRNGRAGQAMMHPDAAENILVPMKSESIWSRFKRIFLRRRQPNTPGLWAFYFLIGGLPFFGLGQMLIPVRDASRHNSVSMQVLVYFLGIFGLLMISSVTGLHRYLLRNDSTLPTRIAFRWLTTGTIMALLIVMVCWLLPRPTPAYSLAGLIPRLTSPNVNASRTSMGQDGQKQNDENANIDSGPPSKNNEAGNENSRQGNSGNKKTDNKRNPVGKDGAKQEGGNSETKAEGGGNKSDKSPSSTGKQEGKPNSDQKNGESNPAGKSDSEKEESDSSSEGGDKSSEQKPDSGANSAGKGDESGKNEAEKTDRPSPDKQESQQQENRRPGRDPQRRNPNSSQQQKNDNSEDENEGVENNQQGNRNSAGQSQAPPAKQSGSLWSGLGQVMKLVIGFIAAIVIAWFAVKHRGRLLPWFHSFLQEMLEFWNRLFKRKSRPVATAAAMAETAKRDAGKSLPGFLQFQNPFANETAKQWSPEKIVRYTYEAFEAWSRDQQCSREPEQTVLEFAHSTGKQFRPLANEVMQLATLYNQIAYAGATVSQSAAMTLSGLWDKLISLYKTRA